MTREGVGRRELLRLVGAGVVAGTIGSGTASASEGQYIVGTTDPTATREVRGRAVAVRRVLDFGPRGQAVAGRFTERALRGLSRRPGVRYIEPDGRYRAIGGVADIDAADAEVPWGVDRVDAEKVHGGTAGAGADIAIVDTGIDNDHPDLVANLGEGISFTVGPRWRDDTSTDPADWDDGNGHGTHCAGIAAAADDGRGVVGVAPGATLHAVKVLDNRGSGSWSDVAAGINYVADRGWDVASLSLGGGESQTVNDACAYAYGKGVLLVAAAGNDGPDTADGHYPSAHPDVVAVGATERDDDIASFSSTGTTLELGAPGRSIYSTYKGGGYETLSGTSMACPHVSGAGGLLAGLGLSNEAARSTLRTTAESPIVDSSSTALSSDEIGHGLLDAEAAVIEAGGATGGDGGTSDTEAPSAPTGLTVEGTTTDSASLSWTASTDDVGVDHYTVYTDGVPSVDTTTLSATVTGLAAETSYQFTVAAVDGAGNESGQSSPVTGTTEPAASGGGTNAPVASIQSVAESQSRNPHAEFDVTWSASDADGDLASVEISLYDATDGGALEERVSAGALAGETTRLKAHKDDGSGHAYTVEVVATDGGGRSATASTTVTEA